MTTSLSSIRSSQGNAGAEKVARNRIRNATGGLGFWGAVDCAIRRLGPVAGGREVASLLKEGGAKKPDEVN